MPGWTRLAKLPTLSVVYSIVGSTSEERQRQTMCLNHQDCGSGGLQWGLWEFPEAWLSEGSQLFIGHLWPFLQVWRGLLGALSWLEQKRLCFPWQSWLSPAVSSGGISGSGMSQ